MTLYLISFLVSFFEKRTILETILLDITLREVLTTLLTWLGTALKWIFILVNVIVVLVMIYVLLVSSEYRQSGLKVYKGVLRSFSLKAFLWALPDLAVRVSFVIFFWRAADYFGWKFLTLPAYSWFAHWIKLIGSFFLQTNVMFEPLFYLKKYSIFLAIPFYLLLLLIIPILAYWEEEMFRGHESWYGRIVSSVLFGLFHLTVNYNLLSIFALMISGYFYTYLYALRKKDLLENPEKFIAKKIIKNISPSQIRKACLYYTTAVHAFQNMLLVTFLFLMLIFKT